MSISLVLTATTSRWRIARSIRERRAFVNTLLTESHALILSTLGISAAAEFLREMALGSTRVIRVRAKDEARARQIIFRYTDKDFSLADAISFAVMERLGMSHAFSFDRHFAQYGFLPLTEISSL